MKRRFTEEQIFGILREQEAGAKVKDSWGTVEAKNKGRLDTYFLNRIKPESTLK